MTKNASRSDDNDDGKKLFEFLFNVLSLRPLNNFDFIAKWFSINFVFIRNDIGILFTFEIYFVDLLRQFPVGNFKVRSL